MTESEKGICTYQRTFYGWVTVSEKGQIALPADARKDLNITQGEKLLVISRKDRKGLMLVKAEIMDDFIKSLAEDR
jgi:looped-hinge helix DNA binding domain, AbrB family